MKNSKRILGLALCAIFALSSLTAFADEAVSQDKITADNVKIETENGAQTVNPDLTGEKLNEESKEDGANNDEAFTNVNNGDITIYINGALIGFDDNSGKPQVIENRTLVPVRTIAETLNSIVEWRDKDQTVHIFRNGKYILLAIDKPDMVVNTYNYDDKNSTIVYTSATENTFVDNENHNVTARLIDGRTMVPLRAVCEAMGATVNYDEKTNTASLTIADNYNKLMDKDIDELILKWNYNPKQPTATVNIKVKGNFEGAVPTLGDGVVVTLDGKTQTAANGGACTFAEVNAGTYTLTVSSIPEGYTAAETTVTVEAGKEASVSILLEKAEDDKDNDNKDNGENSKSDDQQTQKKNETKDNAGNGNNTGSEAGNNDKSGDTENK